MSAVCLQSLYFLLFSFFFFPGMPKKAVLVLELRWWILHSDGAPKSLGGNQVLVQTRATRKDLNNGLFKAQLYSKAAASPCQLHLVV